MACLGGWFVGDGAVEREKHVGGGLMQTDAERGDGMMGLEWLDMCMEAFAAWLVDHEYEVVGYTGRCFDSPLARWLSDLAGYLCGVDDEGRYGWALVDDCYWRPLPRWAHLFSRWTDSSVPQLVTGRQAFGLLALVELALSRSSCLAMAREG
jgi:hypothetical protein